jgi:flagellar L-ring protein precursor FlgH
MIGQKVIATCVSAAVAGMLLCATGSTVSAQSSLWQNRVDRWSNPIGDVRAKRPGDLLVVTIQENSAVQNRDQRMLDKKNKSSASGTNSFSLSGLFGSAAAGTDADQETAAARSVNANTQYTSARGFNDQFTVSVVDALPNGNLLISGKRRIGLEGDERTLVLTGEVRAIDVTPGNMIPSSSVHRLDIRYESLPDGAENAFVNQGWLGKKMNRVWPF